MSHFDTSRLDTSGYQLSGDDPDFTVASADNVPQPMQRSTNAQKKK